MLRYWEHKFQELWPQKIDRNSKIICKTCGVPVLKSKTVNTFEDAKQVADELGYPVIVRVAYTLGGKGGGIAHNEIELHERRGSVISCT